MMTRWLSHHCADPPPPSFAVVLWFSPPQDTRETREMEAQEFFEGATLQLAVV